MHRTVAVLPLVVALFWGSVTPGSSETATVLSGPQLQQAVVGRTLASKSHRGISYTMLLNPDGTGVFVYSGATRDPLTWDIAGDVLCFHSKLSGTECNRVRVSGGGYDFVSSTTGALNNTYTVQ